MEPFVIPKELEKFGGANLPAAAKMITAKGLAPLQPRDLLTCVFAMTLDPDPTVSQAARETFAKFPEGILIPAIEGGLAPQVLDGLARAHKSEHLLEKVVLQKSIHDETLCFLAESGTARVVDIISNNQIRLLQCPRIMDFMGRNPLTSAAVIDRIFSFLEREGVLEAAQPNKEEREVSIDEYMATLGENLELMQDFELPTELMEDLKQEIPSEETAKNLFAKILKMGIMAKIKLGIKGNKEARAILIRDPNKLVSAAVVNSPKVSEDEVIGYACSRTVGDHILRRIYRKKEWRGIYKIQLGLAANPKTPFDVAMQLLKMLRVSDLQGISKSKSVSNAVSTAARRLLEQKQSR